MILTAKSDVYIGSSSPCIILPKGERLEVVSTSENFFKAWHFHSRLIFEVHKIDTDFKDFEDGVRARKTYFHVSEKA